MLRVHQHASMMHAPGQAAFGTFFAEDKSFAALDSDILQHAEQIRRERLSRRAKAQQEAELQASASMRKSGTTDTEEPGVLVGNLIGEDHVNYVMMYNMLTGIRTAVRRLLTVLISHLDS
jgi:1-phosphatidylinositol-4-phosphate 5-kinase